MIAFEQDTILHIVCDNLIGTVQDTPGLSAADLGVAVRITRYLKLPVSRQCGFAFAGVGAIAQGACGTGVDARTARRSFRRLQAAGLIEIDERPGETSIYHIGTGFLRRLVGLAKAGGWKTAAAIEEFAATLIHRREQARQVAAERRQRATTAPVDNPPSEKTTPGAGVRGTPDVFVRGTPGIYVRQDSTHCESQQREAPPTAAAAHARACATTPEAEAAERAAAWEAERKARAEARREAERQEAERQAAASAEQEAERRVTATIRTAVSDLIVDDAGGSQPQNWHHRIVLAHVREWQAVHGLSLDQIVEAIPVVAERWRTEKRTALHHPRDLGDLIRDPANTATRTVQPAWPQHRDLAEKTKATSSAAHAWAAE